ELEADRAADDRPALEAQCLDTPPHLCYPAHRVSGGHHLPTPACNQRSAEEIRILRGVAGQQAVDDPATAGYIAVAEIGLGDDESQEGAVDRNLGDECDRGIGVTWWSDAQHHGEDIDRTGRLLCRRAQGVCQASR